jgi:hypothetical protein
MDRPDWHEKYRILKRKHRSLLLASRDVADELTRTKKRLIRLHRERSFLLEKLLALEEAAGFVSPAAPGVKTKKAGTKRKAAEEATT